MDKSKAIDAAVSQIERQFGKGSIMRMGDEERQSVDCIPTGALALDRAKRRARVGAALTARTETQQRWQLNQLRGLLLTLSSVASASTTACAS